MQRPGRGADLQADAGRDSLARQALQGLRSVSAQSTVCRAICGVRILGERQAAAEKFGAALGGFQREEGELLLLAAVG